MRHLGLVVGGSVLAASLVLSAPGCGSSQPSGFGNDSGLGDSGLPPDDDASPNFGDSSTEAAPPCVGLKCQQVSCGGGAKTTVTGTVYDPAGKNPVYNVIVYVPNAPLDPIKHGATCESCAGVSGKPVVTALTDAKGHFELDNVPVGTNIPLVIQVGKWRRKFTLPDVKQCTDNPVPDPVDPAQKLRLPKNKSEGDMPLIALATGCDPIHTLVQKIGIDPSEYSSGTGNGMVHIYVGKGGGNAGVSGATDAYAFWGSLSQMMKYDIIINECECSPYPRDTAGPAYANMDSYLAAGGRLFASHYHINWFSDAKAGADLKSAATWIPWGSCGTAPYTVDTTFPKGKAMADWLYNLQPGNGKTPTYGVVDITSGCVVRDIKATTPNVSQQWVYDKANYPAYISFNTPTTAQPDQRCGRAVAADLHVGTSGQNVSEQEAVLEFMFFDLASCVQDDGKPPTPPPPN